MLPLSPYYRVELGPCPACGCLVNDPRDHERRHARDERRAREDVRRPDVTALQGHPDAAPTTKPKP